VSKVESYLDRARCMDCGGKCCQIYKPIYAGGTFPEGTIDFEEWCRQFHENRDKYDVEPLFDPIEVHRSDKVLLRSTLLEKNINPHCCEYLGANGCRIPRERRPEQCLSYRCDLWLDEDDS
jgi:Fe-S-cluster containining protein